MNGLVACDVASRHVRLAAAIERAGLDALVITNPCSVRWLTGFTGSNALVIATSTELTLATDGRYADQAPAELAAAGVAAEVAVEPDLLAVVAARVPADACVGAEADHLTWSAQRRLVELLPTELRATEELIAELRAVKDAGEIARLRHAASLADRALARALPMLAEGVAERDVAGFLDAEMRRLGASGPAYETIVASGPNSARPHARPSDRIIAPGDLVVIDVGALFDGYHSDMTRSFIVGDPTPTQRRYLDEVAEAQAAGVATVGVEVLTSAVDAACRNHLDEVGLGAHFTHGTGHGIGLEIHEQPWVNSRTHTALAAGMIHTIEPGVYVPGVGGVRWEDSVMVTPAGAEVITHSPKDPVVAV